MGKLGEVIEEYKKLFRELGLDFGVNKVLFLEALQEHSVPVKISTLCGDGELMHRTLAYRIADEMKECGLVIIYKQGDLTPEEEKLIEENVFRRDRVRVRRDVVKAKRVKFTPKGIIPYIDKRIKELEAFKQKIEEGKVF